MKHKFYKMTASLVFAALTCVITACGSAGVPSYNDSDMHTDLNSTPETTVAEESAQNTESTQNGDLSSGAVPEISIPDGNLPEVTVPDIHIDFPDATVPDINEYMYGTTAAVQSDEKQTITDASGKYSYTGSLFQGGDDKNGYLKIPTDFVDYVEPNSSGRMTQYSDATRNNIVTLAHFEGADYKELVENIKVQKEGQTGIKEIKTAEVTIAGYRAVQLYQYYDDGIDLVTWYIEDPDAPSKSTYYVAIEFDAEHDYLLACSSTFETVADHNRS